MKMKDRCLLLAAGMAIILAAPVYAHDPSEHEGAHESPNCEAMKGMGNMDMSDPVMMAMMDQCRDAHQHDAADEHDDAADHDHNDSDHHHHHQDHDKK